MIKTSVVSPLAGHYLRMSAVGWEAYSQLLRAFEGRPGWKVTYDRGELEIMSPSIAHDFDSRFLGYLILLMADELSMPVRPGGSVTMRRKKRRRGLEPDECFWLPNAAVLAGVRKLDLRVHPPPDLALECVVTHPALDRMAIYAALNVPEVWRLERGALTFHILNGRQYQVVTNSAAFPKVTAADLLPFIQDGIHADDTNEVARRFRAWVRQHHGLANP